MAFAHPSAKGEPKPDSSADANPNRKRGPNPISDSQYLLTSKASDQVSQKVVQVYSICDYV